MTNLATLAPEVWLRNELAPVLRAALGSVHTVHHCNKALAHCDK